MRILIVEDETLVAMMLADSLECGGHEVMGPAATEAEALALCEAVVPELALLDIRLRDGDSGVALARVLAERWGVPVIFASAEEAEARQAREFALGCIHKPYRPETVLHSVELACAVMRGRTALAVPSGFDLFPAAG